MYEVFSFTAIYLIIFVLKFQFTVYNPVEDREAVVCRASQCKIITNQNSFMNYVLCYNSRR